MDTININTGNKYNVFVGSNLLKQSGKLISEVTESKRAIIVTDDIVNKLYSEELKKSLSEYGIEADIFEFKNGEPSKCHYTLIALYDFLCEKQITRSDFLIALGGGVVGDLTGFAAATYLRGIQYIQIPTTLLAQIDSSVGGKTAVDISGGKNLVGAFWQPKAVICDTDTLSTLSNEVFSDGMAEAIKYGVIKDEKLFEQIYSYHTGSDLSPIIKKCISIKADVVANDEFEKGERMLLNFGHTLGHGIEKYYDYKKYTHGKAVAIGMALISQLCEKYGIAKPDTYSRIINCLIKYNLPYQLDFATDDLAACSLNDKKRSQDIFNIIAVKEIGNAFILPLETNTFKEFVKGVYKG